jgi:long-chain acyl-CoA synthetase
MPSVHWPIIRQVLRDPQRIAVVDDQRSWRAVEVLGGALHLARLIEQVSHRPHVGVLLPTGGAFPMAALAIWMTGRVLVPVNYLQTPADQQYIIDDSEMDTLITVGPMLDFVGFRPRNVRLIELDKVRHSFKGVPPLRLPPLAESEQTAVILYTSGTSGKSKGVMLTHGNLRSNVRQMCAHVGLTSANCFLGVLPQFHSFGLTVMTLVPLIIGAKVVYTARFMPRKLIELMREHKPDIFVAIPSMYNALLHVKDARPDDWASIHMALSGGEPLPSAVRQAMLDQFNVTLREGYGLTETSPVASVNTVRDTRPGSVGTLIGDVRCRIVDDQERDLPRDQEGEIRLTGPNIMKGYYKLPEQTAACFDARGYFRTGDWGKLDADGFLHITGRIKEMLIIAGENVFPREIEEVLNQHPTVKDSAVVGRQDPMRGEVPVAYVELHEGASFNEKELRQFTASKLPSFKVPRDIRCLDALPRNATGKIVRRMLPKD